MQRNACCLTVLAAAVTFFLGAGCRSVSTSRTRATLRNEDRYHNCQGRCLRTDPSGKPSS